ncbi:MAG TPA: lysylphosphatidylglycerol synthase domain-containing protein [Longimicrobiales bacterium]
MKPKTVLWRVAQVALAIIITLGIVRTLAPELGKVSWHDFANFQPSWWRLLLSTAFLLGFYMLHAWLWRRMTVEFGRRPLSYRSALRIYFVSGLGRYIPGKLWQVAGMAMLAQRAGISPVAATAASLLGQLGFITTGLVYLALLIPARGVALPIVSALVLTGAVWVGYRARHWVAGQIKRIQPAVDMLDRLSASTALQWWLWYGASWIVLGVAFVLFTSAFVTLSLTQQLYVGGTVAAAYLGGLLAFFSIAGLGVREAVMGSLLVTVMSPPAALVVSVASRIWFTLGELLPILLGKHRET